MLVLLEIVFGFVSDGRLRPVAQESVQEIKRLKESLWSCNFPKGNGFEDVKAFEILSIEYGRDTIYKRAC